MCYKFMNLNNAGYAKELTNLQNCVICHKFMNLNDVNYANDVTYPLNCVNTHNILNLNANNYAKKYNILHILRKNFKNHKKFLQVKLKF